MKYILCYGDSNTWGHNPEGGRYTEKERWTGILQEHLKDRAKIYEEGLCGRTVMYDDPIAPDRNGRAFLDCCIQTHQPFDLIIFMLGTNDVRHIFTPSAKDIALGMDNLVRISRNPLSYGVGCVPKILVISPARIRDEIFQSDFYGMYDEESVRKSKELYGAYRSVIKTSDAIHLLDASQIAEVSILDCIHLTRKGHRDLAEAVEHEIHKMLNIQVTERE